VSDHVVGIDLDTDASNDYLDGFSDFDADDYGSTEECVLVGFLGFEDDYGLPQGVASSLDHAATHNVSHPAKGKTGLPRCAAISEDDFDEGPQRNAFVIIRGNAEKLFSKDPKLIKRRPEAIDFFFTRLDNQEDVTFQLCCEVLDSREDVIRLRIIYEFWLRHVQFTNPMPFEAVPVPEVAINEIYMLNGNLGLTIARSIWNWPGVGIEKVIYHCCQMGYQEKEIEHAIERLRDAFILSEHLNGWYLTGRNPIMQSMRDQTRYGGKAVGMMSQTIHWSRLY
jgi:hypothetical protein